MKNRLLILCLIGFVTTVNSAMASNDSIYFYKSGQIIYKRATTEIDSVTFVPIDYYEVKNNEAIFQAIQAIPEISLFASILENTGLHKSLANRTIWAPTNEALANIDLNNRSTIDSLVKNHVSEYAIPTTFRPSVYTCIMLNGKVYPVYLNDSVHRIENSVLIQENINHSDCVIHIIDRVIPIKMNVGDYLLRTTAKDEAEVFKEYLQHFIKDDGKGGIYNVVTRNLSDLFNENSIYIVIVPTNRACSEAVDKLYSILHVTDDTITMKKLMDDCKWLTVRNQFIYIGYLAYYWYTRSTSLPDSMKSTFEQTFHSKDIYEDSVSTINLSNGRIIFVDTIRHLDKLFVQGDHVIEAEKAVHVKGISAEKEIVLPDTAASVSRMGYLKCMPIGSSNFTKSGLSVYVPNMRPGRYSIFVDIVPANYEDSTDVRPNKLSFYVSSADTTSKSVVAKETLMLKNVVTNPTAPTRVTVAENYFFPYVGIFREPGKTPLEGIKILNEVLTTQTESFDRTFRIDKVIFERVD